MKIEFQLESPNKSHYYGIGFWLEIDFIPCVGDIVHLNSKSIPIERRKLLSKEAIEEIDNEDTLFEVVSRSIFLTGEHKRLCIWINPC